MNTSDEKIEIKDGEILMKGKISLPGPYVYYFEKDDEGNPKYRVEINKEHEIARREIFGMDE